MNADLVRQALEKIPNTAILVNLVSRRVRQLNSGAGSQKRPLLANLTHLSAADVALSEIIEEKMNFELPEAVPLTRPTGKGRQRPQHWRKL